ncbi:hypothetical protein QX25_17760 (plasmid) [Stutzerimonas stutzeri]|jgi:type II secretory pathway component PulF|nr:hypothetical protein QX25_17760 [Stutzerimonas stutzeri]
MAYWQIRYFDESGVVQTLPSISASSREQALGLSGLPERTIDNVRIDHLGGIKSVLLERRFPLIDQVVMLSSIVSKLEAGGTVGRAIKESVPYQKIGITQAQLDACEKPKDYLRLLRFHDTVVLLAETGDSTGNLATSLERAGTALADRMEAEKEYRKNLLQGVAYTALGLGFAILVPLAVGPMLRDYTEVHKIPLNLNFTSHTLLFLDNFYSRYGVAILGACGTMYAFRDKFWDAARKWPGLRMVNDQVKITRAISFVTNYQMLSFSGFSNQQSFNFLQTRAKGRTAQLYQTILERQVEGWPLSKALDNDEWPEIVSQNLNGFEETSPKEREKVLNNLNKALKIHYSQASAKVARLALAFGMGMMTLAVLSLALGFYLPLISVSQNIRGL